MNIRIHPCFWIAALLVSCDKPQGTRDATSSEQSKSRATRVDRLRSDYGSNKQRQPREALAAAEKIEDTEARDKALAEFAWGAFESDQNDFLKAFEKISTDSEDKIPLIEFYAMRLAEKNPNEALTWADSLGSKKETDTAKEQVIQVLMDKDPQHAAKLLPKPGIDGAEIDGTALQTLHRWMAVTPQDAAAWVSTFPSGDARKVAIEAVVSDWAQMDSKAAFSWLATLNNKAIHDEASHAMIETFKEQPQEIREAWIQQADPSIRNELERQPAQIQEEVEPSISPPSE